MAQTAFATLNAQPSWLSLQEALIQGNECSQDVDGVPNVNTASPGNTVQFYSGDGYINGASEGLDSTLTSSPVRNGTWTSSNPLGRDS